MICSSSMVQKYSILHTTTLDLLQVDKLTKATLTDISSQGTVNYSFKRYTVLYFRYLVFAWSNSSWIPSLVFFAAQDISKCGTRTHTHSLTHTLHHTTLEMYSLDIQIIWIVILSQHATLYNCDSGAVYTWPPPSHSDTVCDLEGSSELAKYGEYSGTPSESQMYDYAKTILSLMTEER